MNATNAKTNFHGLIHILAILTLIILVATGVATWRAAAQEPVPWLIAFPENDAVEGWEWPDGAEVQLTIDHAPGFWSSGISQVTTWGDPRTYVRIEFGQNYDLQPGDEVTLTYGEIRRSHVVQNLAVTAADAASDTVAGTADPGAALQVWPHGYDQVATIQTTAGADGTWKADFSGIFDLVVGTGGRSQIVDEVGNATAVDWSVPTSWRDDFDTDALAPGWYWQNGDSGEWSLTDEPGFLRLTVSNTSALDGNLLLREVQQGDFVIKTHLIFEPNTNFQFAGLYIYQDDGNTLAFGRAFCDVPESCVGNGIYFDYIADGNWTGNNFGTPVDSPNEAYLRLERRGEMVKAFYSYEGITWFEIGTHWIPPDFQINGVGLVASQDYDTSDENISAYFDFFELTEGWGFLPEGFHDYDQGDVPSWACNAGGWAADPDDREADLAIEIDVDGNALPDWLSAGEYREDLDNAGVCMNGNCGFSTSLWGTISSYEPHSVVAYAQDIPSGEWVRLSNSPKTLTCRTYDIYAFDPLTGETRQITNLRDTDEYNPSWSPNGKKVAHDVLFGDGSFEVYITDLKTGLSAPLYGAGFGSNDAVWSPNGKWIAFDRDSSLFIVPSEGGAATLIRSDAVSADWSPNGKRLVFQDTMDGSIRTVPVDGGDGGETFIAESGSNPVWSPDGNWIAYQKDGDIWKMAVNVKGEVFGDPIQITTSPFDEGQPTWSSDSQTIVYHAGLSRDYDLWSIPALGGIGTWLTGGIEFGDYDPVYAKNSSSVAYASFSPEGQAARNWGSAFTYELPAGYWAEGEHSYFFENTYTSPEPGDIAQSSPIYFSASDSEPAYDGFVLLRAFSVIARVGGECQSIGTFNSDQTTRFHYGWMTGYPVTYAEALDHFNSMVIKVHWDGQFAANLLRHEIYPRTSQWNSFGYNCTFTEAPARSKSVGNFSVAWNPFNTEEIVSLRWKGSENLTNAWQNPACLTDLEYFGNSWVSENEGTDEFWFNSLVGWGTAGTWTPTDAMVDISSISSGCPGSANIPIHTTYQFFSDELRANLIEVQRFFEFGDSYYEHDVRPFIPRLYPLDGFTQVLHPDASGTTLVTQTTEGCGYGCLNPDWNGTWFAIHNPDSGLGMIVQHVPSTISAALWLDDDGGSFTNSSSVLLLQPSGGFTGTVTETEYLCFYDSDTWTPSLTLPDGCQP